MKKYFFVFFLVLVINIFTFTGCIFKRHNELYLPEITAFEMFKGSGAEFVNSEIIFQARLDTEYQNEDDLNKLVKGLIESLGINENCIDDEENIEENDFIKIIEIREKTRENETVSIIVELEKTFEFINAGDRLDDRLREAGYKIERDEYGIRGEENELKEEKDDLEEAEGRNPGQSIYREGVINLSLSGSSACDRIQEIRGSVEAVFSCCKIKPEVKCTVTGFFEGKLDSKKMNEVCINMFSTLDARKVKDITGKNLVGVSAYSPTIGSFIEIDGNRSNIQLNFRYSAYEDKTFIWIGVPSIF